MIAIDKAVVARIQKGKAKYEILVDPELAQQAQAALKKGKFFDLTNVLAVDSVFDDVKKGARTPKKILQSTFETDDVLEVAAIILKEGVVHTTGEQRDKKRDDAWNKIVALISMNAIDGQTKKPIPSHVIADALHATHFKLDTRKVEDQLPDAIKHVKKVIALTFNERTLQLNNVTPSLARMCLDLCKKMGSVQKENWGADKSLTVVVKVPGGLREEFMDKINDITRGKIDMKLLD